MYIVKRRDYLDSHVRSRIEVVMPQSAFDFIRRHADDYVAAVKTLIAFFRDYDSKMGLSEAMKIVDYIAGRENPKPALAVATMPYQTLVRHEDEDDHVHLYLDYVQVLTQ